MPKKADLQDEVDILKGDVKDLTYRLEREGKLPIQMERKSFNTGYKQAIDDVAAVVALTTPEGSLQRDYANALLAAVQCHYSECLQLWEIGENEKQPMPDISLHTARH